MIYLPSTTYVLMGLWAVCALLWWIIAATKKTKTIAAIVFGLAAGLYFASILLPFLRVHWGEVIEVRDHEVIVQVARYPIVVKEEESIEGVIEGDRVRLIVQGADAPRIIKVERTAPTTTSPVP